MLVFLNFCKILVILWSLCSVVFHALTLKLPIQTSLSVAPKLPVSLHSGENCANFSKTSTAQVQTPENHSPVHMGDRKSEIV